MSLMKIFGSKRKDLVKTIDESEAGEDFTPDCPAIIELQQDKELSKELNIQVDSDVYTLDDMLVALGLSKTKMTKCNINLIKVNDSLIKIHFSNGKILLKRDGQNFTFDWEI